MLVSGEELSTNIPALLIKMSSLPKCCSMALAQCSMLSSSLTSSWIGLTLSGAPSAAAASSPLWMSRDPKRIW